MRNTKLWSVLLVCVLLCACVLGALFTGASAGGTVTYGVNYTDGIDADKQKTSISEVFADVEAAIEEGSWIEGNTLEILFAGSLEAKVANSELVFGQKTIFTSTGKKLPITIKGTEASNASTITVTADKIACANDYTFESLTLDLHSHVVEASTYEGASYNLTVNFYAGSGNVTMKNVSKFKAGSQIFGDNYTAEAFAGWTKADVEALQDEDDCILTSVTFDGTGFEGALAVAPESDANDFNAGICAVGATRDNTTGADAYDAVIAEDCTVTPADTKAKIAIVSGTIDCRIGGYMAEYPARVHTAIIEQTGGSVGALSGDEAGGHVLNKIENGNVVIYAENATKTGTVRVFYGGNGHNDMTNTSDAPAGEYGNVTVTCKNIKTGGSVYITGSSNKIIPGKATVTLDRFYHNGKSAPASMASFEFLGIGAMGGVENNLSNCRVKGFSGMRFEKATTVELGDVVNNLTNVDYYGSKDKFNYNPVAMRNKAVGVKVKSITNNLTDCVIGSNSSYETIFYGALSAVVSGTVKNVITGTQINHGYYGTSEGSANRVENYYNNGSTLKTLVHGTDAGTVNSVLNEVAGATFTANLEGAYNTTVKDKVETNVLSGSLKALYVVFGGQYDAIGGIVNTIRGGTISGDALLGGYGGTQVKSVTNNIYGGHFNNANKFVAFSNGNQNWTGQVLGDVVNNVYGGTFDAIVYGGARGGCVHGNVYNNIKSGTFNGNFYGGNYGPTYYKAEKYTWYNDFLNKGIEGTIYNMIGEEGKADSAPVFNSVFYGGDRGVLSDSAYANESNCSIENTVYNATFNKTYYGGNSKDAYASNQITHDPYSITYNVTNNIHNAAFNSSYFGGSSSSAHVATEGETITATVAGGKITNNLHNAVIKGEYVGGFGTGTAAVTVDVTNHFYNVTLTATENFLGHGNSRPSYGTIENVFEDGFETDTAYVYGAGCGIVYPAQGETVAVINTVNGGSFDGFWAMGGKVGTVVNGDVETNVYGGTFNTYDDNSLINGIAVVRNGTLNGNSVLNIYGGTFGGQVCGGTFLGSNVYRDRYINGSTALKIYGGTFMREVYACSSSHTLYATGGSVVEVIPTEGKKIAFCSDAEITKLDASSGVAIDLGKAAYLEIEALVGTLKVNQTEAWQPRTYAEIQAASQAIEASANEGVAGAVEIVGAETTVLRGVNAIASPYAANLLLSDRIQIKLLYNEADINALGEDFELVFKSYGGLILGTATKESIGEAKNGYYTVVLQAMGLNDFTCPIICAGNGQYRMVISVLELAKMGAKHYTETEPNAVNAKLFESIANLASVANFGELLYGQAPVYESVPYDNWSASNKNEDVLKMKSVSLIMSDAMGIRFSGSTATENPEIKVFSGDREITQLCVIEKADSASDGVYALTIDIYVNVASMTEELLIRVTDGADEPAELFTMNIRVDALASKVVDADPENVIAKCALAYIQAADAYKTVA